MALRYTFRPQLRRHIDWAMSVSDEGNDLGVRASILNLRQSAHPIDDLQSRIEEVNGMAATAETKLFSPLHDGGLEPELVEPVGEHRAGDTGTRDEHASTVHRQIILHSCG
jgi:hypothetical protein